MPHRPPAPRPPAARRHVVRPARRALALVAAALAVASAACERGGRRSYVEQAVALAPSVERATGLRFKSPPKVEVRSREQVRELVRKVLDEPTARTELAAQQLVWRRLGLLEDSTDLRATLEGVLGDQVVGYYDPPSKTLYVVQGADSADTEVTLRHELVHALQDQYRNLDSLLKLRAQNDRAAAIHAALEGQATWVQFGSTGDLTVRFPGGWERARQTIRENMERMPVLANAPLVVRETLLFPYLSGAELARRVAGDGHPDSVLLRLPESTAQVLHAERYLGAKGGRPTAPVPVRLAAPSTGTVAAENTLGEFESRLALFQHTNDLPLAARATIGWAGDRWQIVRVGGSDALVWATAWDTGTDAAEFFEAMSQAVPTRYRGARQAQGGAGDAGSTTRRFTTDAAPGGARTVTLRVADVQGRPVVLYVDAPSGAAAALTDVARVSIGAPAR